MNASTTVYVECIQQYVFSTSSGISLTNTKINQTKTRIRDDFRYLFSTKQQRSLDYDE